MDTVYLDNIKIGFSTGDFLKKLKMDLDDDDEYAADVLNVYEEGKKIARPKAIYKAAYIEDRGEDWVVIDGIRFASRILSLNLKDVHRVFPYVITCGRELYEWENSFGDPIERYWADAFCEMALREASNYMEKDFENRIRPGKTASMNPGSLPDWPLGEQRPLFKLLGERVKDTGVELSESFLMIPMKSVSGIKFPTEFSYQNCMLCPRERCPGRRAKYDPEAFSRSVENKV